MCQNALIDKRWIPFPILRRRIELVVVYDSPRCLSKVVPECLARSTSNSEVVHVVLRCGVWFVTDGHNSNGWMRLSQFFLQFLDFLRIIGDRSVAFARIHP